MNPITVLRVDASMTRFNSSSRMIADELIEKLSAQQAVKLINRDLAEGVPYISEEWIQASFTDSAERSEAQKKVLAESDEMVAELKKADVLVMSVPVYNFGVPAAFKAWIDMIARARETFRYTEAGPVGLLRDIETYLIISSGSTGIDSNGDYVSGYIRDLFSFLGITNIRVIPCVGLMTDYEQALANARNEIEALSPGK